MPPGVTGAPDVSVRRLLSLAWPLALHGLVTVGVASNDVVLLGRESPAVLASAVVATSLTTLLVMTLSALGIATQIDASRAFGAGDDAAARITIESSLRTAAAIGVLPWLLCWAAAPWLTDLAGGAASDPAISGAYLRITLVGLPFAVVSSVLRAYATAAGSTRIVPAAGLVTAGVDVAASLAGGSALGWPGVAAGTVVGYATGAGVLVTWSRRLPTARRPRWSRTAGGAERGLLRLGWPEMLLAAFSSGAGLVVVVVLAGSPPSVLAASRLLDVQVSLAWVLLSSVGQAALTVLGAASGSGRPAVFDRAVRTTGAVLVAIAVATLLAGGVVGGPVAAAVGGPAVAAVVGGWAWLAWAQVLWQAGCVLALTVCRACRDTRAALWASTVAEYAVFLPAGLVLCRLLDQGLVGVLVAHHLFWATFVTIAVVRAVRARRTVHPDVRTG